MPTDWPEWYINGLEVSRTNKMEFLQTKGDLTIENITGLSVKVPPLASWPLCWKSLRKHYKNYGTDLTDMHKISHLPPSLGLRALGKACTWNSST